MVEKSIKYDLQGFVILSFKFCYSLLLNKFAKKWIVLNLLTYEQMNSKKGLCQFLVIMLQIPVAPFLIINSGVSRRYKEKNVRNYHG